MALPCGKPSTRRTSTPKGNSVRAGRPSSTTSPAMWSARAPGPEGVFRRYREGDLHALVRLFTDAVHRLAGEYYTAALLAAWAPQPPDLNGWTARLASLETLVAEIDGELAGFIAYE